MTQAYDADAEALQITRPGRALDPPVINKLCQELASCPDVAFAHLTDVLVPAHQPAPTLTLFVWLKAEAVRSMRAALNLVAEAVSRSLPDRDQFIDVIILNSAPELLEQVEAVDCLLVENDREERQAALRASSSSPPGETQPTSRGPWWWPFS